MRSSTRTVISQSPAPQPLKEERLASWAPQRLSDRKLVELQHRLERLHGLGDTFAAVTLSDEALTRLRGLTRKPTA